jgi:hypothetical protein
MRTVVEDWRSSPAFPNGRLYRNTEKITIINIVVPEEWLYATASISSPSIAPWENIQACLFQEQEGTGVAENL